MTASDFCCYINTDLLPNTSHSFQRVDSSKKGVYIDGHERQDVVEERTRYLDRVHAIESNHLPPPSPSDVLQEHESGHMKDQSATKWLVTIFHDESTFQSNEDQRYMWCQPDQTAIKPKSRGSEKLGIMFEHTEKARGLEMKWRML
ncbi:uncharacterized protein LOC134177408 isoform X3 [Corticium candelabrum]|uniref:uncharacterized protein LOC134177408 isoform X3 n=1 Tax=Corticium candelabrum TaxID=121492 RepID=UPI002E268C9F|nr:uncharacterized protein LOC134177408 isoform X3 [Corticium candelabrum]